MGVREKLGIFDSLIGHEPLYWLFIFVSIDSFALLLPIFSKFTHL